jgi:hypothetical protein
LPFLLALVIGLSSALTGRAQVVVYNNLGTSPYDQDGYATFGFYSDGDTYVRGMQFTPSQTVMLSSLELALGEAYFPSGDVAQSGTANVMLTTDNNNKVGTVLESWTSASISGSPGNASVLTFTSVLTPLLKAGTNYWIVLGDASGSGLSGAWCFAETSAPSDVLTVWTNVDTGAATYEPLTRGYQTLVTGNVLPSLSITHTKTNTFVVSWPASASGWVLQSTNFLAKSTLPWSAVTLPYISTPTNFYVVLTNPPAKGNQFFRLQGP